MRRGEGGEDGGSVRDGAECPVLMLIPDQGVPVEEEHQGSAHQRPQILSGEIVNYTAPGKPAHAGQSHSDGGVEVASGNSAAYHHSEEYANGPPADITSLMRSSLSNITRLLEEYNLPKIN